MKSNKRTLAAILISLLLTQYLVFVILPRSFIGNWVYTPSQSAITQFEWISEQYGFGNKSVIVLTAYDPQQQEVLRWARAITGMDVYVGPLIGLIEGQPDLFEQQQGLQGTKYVLTSYSLIVIPSEVYPLTSLEREFASKTTFFGVYTILLPLEINSSTMQQYSKWMDPLPLKNWVLLRPSVKLNFSVSFDIKTLIIFEDNRPSAMMVYQMEFKSPTSASFLLCASSGKLNNLKEGIEVYYTDGSVTGTHILHRESNASQIGWAVLDRSKLIDRIRFVVSASVDYGVYHGWTEFDYIALL
jgi:hypothetical protein